jgi:hypothetical protein
MRTPALFLTSSIALSLLGCNSPRRNPDAGMPTFDAPAAPIDAPFVMADAFVAPSPDAAMRMDAGTPTSDAFAGTDAFEVADDAFIATDAFAPRDAFTAADAFVPRDAWRDDAGPVTCTPLPATGTETSSGDTSLTALRWLRPLAGTCPATSFSSVGTDVPYQAFVFCNEGADGTFDFEVAASPWDSYLVIYDGPAIASDALQCLEGDDDSGVDGALVSGLSIAAGQTVTVVVSGFDNSDSGTFTLDVTRN